MIRFFGIPIQTLTHILLIITLVIVGIVALLALFQRVFFKIGVRNIPRRRTQMLLIVFALMLSTTLLASVLASGDVLDAAIQSVAVYNWGSVDELIQGSGSGDLHVFSDRVYRRVQRRAHQYQGIAAVGGILRETDLLVADQTSRQVRSSVTALGIIPGSEAGFGGMADQTNNKHRTIASLGKNEVYLNLTMAKLLNARRGDMLYLYAQRWPGRRYQVRVAGIVGNDGLVGDTSYMLSQATLFQQIENAPGRINQIYIANHGNDGISDVELTDEVSATLKHWLPRGIYSIPVKQQGVQVSQTAQEIFARVFALFALFALSIGLLLIFLIFVLLAAERRAEMGMARAIGVQRRHLVLMFLFEGTVYDLLSSFIGVVAGVAVGAGLVALLEPILARFNFPLHLTLQPDSLIIAYCLGVIFTFLSVAISSWLVSRMTVVEALRDLPEPSHVLQTPGELGTRLLALFSQLGCAISGKGNWSATKPQSAYIASSLAQIRRARLRRIRHIVLEQIPDVLVELIRAATRLGFVPLFVGIWLMQWGLDQTQILPFSLGLSLLVIGCALLLRMLVRMGIRQFYYWTKLQEIRLGTERQRAFFRSISPLAALVGGALVAYWALPFNVLGQFGLPRFQGGIEVFFVAGVMMVLGAAWALVANASLIAQPLLALCAKFPNLYAAAKLASAYPLQRRFRTGLSVIMFGLVVFAMTIMAVITSAMQSSYADISKQTGGYDIQGTPYFKSLGNINSALRQHGFKPQQFTAIGERQSTAVGVLQLSAPSPRWTVYPAQIINGGFLQGYGLHLTARAQGFNSDGAVWHALQTHTNYALIDSSSLPSNFNVSSNHSVYDPSASQASTATVPTTPPGLNSNIAFKMSGVYQGESSFPATPLWVVGLQEKQAVKLTVIGVVDNSDAAHFGLYIPNSASNQTNLGAGTDVSGIPGLSGFGPNMPGTPGATSYYFKVAPGQDPHAVALALGSAFLGDGLETTVLPDLVWQARGPRILLSDLLLGVVGMTLLLGVAALAITGTRAVVERRQQIGMLRALGCQRLLIQSAFLLESFMVGVAGSALGIVLGLLLAKNIFAANFFEQYQTGLNYAIPWQELGVIIIVSLVASFLGAILPAWQAGRITPAEALRYQ